MKKKIFIIGFELLAVVAGFFVFFLFQCGGGWCRTARQPIENFFAFSFQYAPCERPITYALGSFSDKFGLSRQAFLSVIKDVEAIWEKPFGKDLFAHTENGTLKINLIYDYRQQATSKLKSLGIVVGGDRSSYDELKIKYAARKTAYAKLRAEYDARVALFTERKNTYDREVQYWNTRGGAQKTEYTRLREEEEALGAEVAEIRKLEADIAEYINDINSMVVVLNRLVTSLNLNAEKYNEIGASRGEEFTEGDYQSNGYEQKINIYEFSSREKLVRVLAHEFGHALGLEHIEDPKAIMYRLNTSANEKLTADDLKELNAHCAAK